MTDTVQPIIIRRKKVYAADGHHGGAWKVAYADFVTAMMAFFLLMWLLNATTEEQRKGIADYFNPNIPLAAVSGGGADALSGSSIFAQNTLSQDGIGAKTDTNQQASDASEEDALEAKVALMNIALQGQEGGLADHMLLKMSPEGLVIELIDQSDRPLFEIGSAHPSDVLQTLTLIISESFGDVANDVKIVGHTDSRAYALTADYTNWELSTDRANTARRLLMGSGFPSDQISEVSGKSSTEPLSDNPLDPQNRRISITILSQKDA